MLSINNVTLAGNLTRDPELRHIQSGTALCKFGIAVNEKYTVDGEKREKTHFIDCTAWGRTAEVIAQYFKKGRHIYIEGSLEYSSWEKDGQKRNALSIKVASFQFTTSSDAGDGPSKQARGRTDRVNPKGDADYGDIPF